MEDSGLWYHAVVILALAACVLVTQMKVRKERIEFRERKMLRIEVWKK